MIKDIIVYVKIKGNISKSLINNDIFLLFLSDATYKLWFVCTIRKRRVLKEGNVNITTLWSGG